MTDFKCFSCDKQQDDHGHITCSATCEYCGEKGLQAYTDICICNICGYGRVSE